jgi:hypothetical protein
VAQSMNVNKKINYLTLDLNGEEAAVLVKVLRQIGGDPGGPRGLCDNILHALYAAEVEEADVPCTGSVYLGDRSWV